MSTGSPSDGEDPPEEEPGLRMELQPDPRPAAAPTPPPQELEEEEEEALERRKGRAPSSGKGRGRKGPPGKRRPSSEGGLPLGPGGKQVQRHAANARERARMRVLSKAFSRLKTTLPWVPPDTKLSKLDTLRLASSYIAHLRQVLAGDKHGAGGGAHQPSGYSHPISLTWPFMVAGKPENELKEAVNTARLCGPTAS